MSEERDQLRPTLLPLSAFATTTAVVAGHRGQDCVLTLLVADREALRERGLSHVTDPDLSGSDGMLFVFPEDVEDAFWMRDTPLPLSLAFVDSAGVVESTVDMAPGSVDEIQEYPPLRPYRYGLEMPQGQFAELGIAAGSTLILAGDISAVD